MCQYMKKLDYRVKNNPMDFVTIMSYIPIRMIFEYLTTNEWAIFQCLLVSKRWRSYLLSSKCSFLWRCARWECQRNACSPAFIMMEKTLPYIRTIDARGWMPEKIRIRYRSILGNVNLDQIQELKIDTTHIDLFIPKVGKNLKSLTLAIDYFRTEETSQQLVDVEQVLNNCPQLVHLAFATTSITPPRSPTSAFRNKDGLKFCSKVIKPFPSMDHDEDDEDASTTSKKMYPNLRTLMIHNQPLKPYILGALFQRSPHLLAFGTVTSDCWNWYSKRFNRVVQNKEDVQNTMEQLEQYCITHLKYLLVIPDSPRFLNDFSSTIEKVINVCSRAGEEEEKKKSHSKITTTTTTTTTGLKHMVTAPERGIPLKYFGSLLKKSQRTLETLTIDFFKYLYLDDEEYEKKMPRILKHWRALIDNVQGSSPS
ncbi:hypothetical protein BDA99DRAFT_90612 [Phascolomyces articulosus]|uniref:F-box domain-containing protein n=1 Tax=Phascolomyces articulosus TaxID=60185 RepID=A0AAD5K884_9FUNG|nr:hypothetical protein BDA99DRAFT_90612 [Phascolomyces articulosus]